MKQGSEISIRAFAKQIKVSEGAVRKAVKEGRFTKGYNPETKKINPVEAAKDPWVKQQGVIKPKAGISRAKAIVKLQSKGEKKDRSTNRTVDDIDAAEDEINNSDIDLPSLIASIKIHSGLGAGEAMRRREIIELARAKMKLAEEQGVLVRKDAVDRVFYKFASELKKNLFNMPQRTVLQIMACKNEVEGINILKEELTVLLNAFCSHKITFEK